ncbi:DUF2273 domain-containing protein [Paenibacillus hunanensis]|nr:DUF2273 domain-containing protein [Paenibacillus hunanensis]MCL9660898.1 DUF2273 domain-containing protein [Paenibacillus hunanensis]WPP43760.1 DUF2273 domain-containing protein [Paenibacillus hunanensis]
MMELLLPYRRRILWTLLGLIVGILWITIGFGYTLLIVACMLVGYLIGKWQDGALNVQKWVQFFTR